MKINTVKMYDMNELRRRLAQVRLRGYQHGAEDVRPLVYEDATITPLRSVHASGFIPTQAYVLESELKKIEVLYDRLKEFGIDLFKLWGFCELDTDNGIKCLTPPIVEQDTDGRSIIIADGMHRCYMARLMRKDLNVMFISGKITYPYYAYALEEKWKGVKKVSSLEGVVRKKYRDPERYKALFRDYTDVFPGIQEKRKST